MAFLSLLNGSAGVLRVLDAARCRLDISCLRFCVYHVGSDSCHPSAALFGISEQSRFTDKPFRECLLYSEPRLFFGQPGCYYIRQCPDNRG